MNLRRFLTKLVVLSFLGSTVVALLFAFFLLKKDKDKDLLEIVRFTGKNLSLYLERFIKNRISVLEFIAENPGINPPTPGIYYIIKNGKIVFVSDERLSSLVGTSPRWGEGVKFTYSIVMDAPVLRITKTFEDSVLVYEEKLDEIKSIVKRVIESLPLKLSILIVDRSGRVIYYRKKWSFFGGSSLNLIGRFEESFLAPFPVLNIKGEKYLSFPVTLSTPSWTLYILHPLSEYNRHLIGSILLLGISVVSLLGVFFLIFYRAEKKITQDLEAIVSAIDSGELDKLKEKNFYFSEFNRIKNSLLGFKWGLYRFKWYLDATLSFAKNAIISLGNDTNVMFASHSAYSLFGVENDQELKEVLETNQWLMKDVEEANYKGSVVEKSKKKVLLQRKRDRVPKILNYSIHPFKLKDISGCIIQIEDVTKEQELQERLFLSQKMESLGILAGGVAHDFNNILAVLSGYIELLRKSFKKDYIDIMEKQIERAATLTKQLLDFARRSPSEKKVLNLKPMLKEFAKFIERVFPPNIEIFYEDDGKKDYLIEADPSKIHQVLMNLAFNAKDAMPKGGKLTFGLSTENGNVVLEVKDTGVGIPEDIKDKIFYPFFTTKGAKGTGLGLSQVYGIVKEHGGEVKVESETGKGTCFKLIFPRTEKPLRIEGEKEVEAQREARGDVVIVDDNTDFLEMVKAYLETRGFNVSAFSKGNEALGFFKENRAHVALIDYLLPDINGLELAEKIAEKSPSTKIVIMTGNPDEFVERKDIPVLQKPFKLKELEDVLRKALES